MGDETCDVLREVVAVDEVEEEGQLIWVEARVGEQTG